MIKTKTPAQNKIKAMKSEKVFLWVFFAIFALYGLTLIAPAFWTLYSSLKTGYDYYDSFFSFPKIGNFQWQNYATAFTAITYNNTPFYMMFVNSLWLALVMVAVNIGASTLTAYAMAKFRFPCKTLLYSIAIFIQVVPIIGTGGARYKFYYNAGLINNPLLIWLSWAGGFDFAFIVLYGYFKSISSTYMEAAAIDGASNLRVMFRIMLPQAIPAIVSLMILNFITAWNDYGTPLMYLSKFPTMAVGLYIFATESNFLPNSTPTYLAAVVFAMIPPIIIFAFTQKIVMNNVTAGGLKG